MSLFKLKNMTGSNSSAQAWAKGYVFPPNVAVDLLDGVIGVSLHDIIGIKSGRAFDSIRALILGGTWKLNNGVRDYYFEEAIYMLTNGSLQGFELIGEETTVVSHDLCHPTTWYQKATQVTDEILRRVDDAYTTAHKNLICLRRGFMYQENTLTFQESFNVKVNDVVVTDLTKFEVEPITGTITFVDGFITTPATDVVKCTYEHGEDSTYEIQTCTDYLWRILKTEVQLDAGIIITSPVIMEIVIDHPSYGANIVMKQYVYKNLRDFLNGSNLGYSIPAFGGTKEDAGYSGQVIILPFPYKKPTELGVGLNARIRIRLEDNIAANGKFGTVTFYIDKVKL